MIVLAWIGQVILFFIFWRLLHWIISRTVGQNITLVAELLINLGLAIVLLIVLDNVHSAWWSMGMLGALVGVETGMIVAKSR